MTGFIFGLGVFLGFVGISEILQEFKHENSQKSTKKSKLEIRKICVLKTLVPYIGYRWPKSFLSFVLRRMAKCDRTRPGCKIWYHQECEAIPENVFEDEDEETEWFCSHCKKNWKLWLTTGFFEKKVNNEFLKPKREQY